MLFVASSVTDEWRSRIIDWISYELNLQDMERADNYNTPLIQRYQNPCIQALKPCSPIAIVDDPVVSFSASSKDIYAR